MQRVMQRQTARQTMLQEYFELAERQPGTTVATALRTRSSRMRDIIVAGATKAMSNAESLKEMVLGGRPIVHDITNFRAIADLGRLVILQNQLLDDLEFGERLLEIVLRHGLRRDFQKRHALTLVQHLLTTQRPEEARELLKALGNQGDSLLAYLYAELSNPFTHSTDVTFEWWMDKFNAPFIDAGLAPVSLTSSRVSPFDRLTSDTGVARFDADERSLVSVVLTSFQPDLAALQTAVRSILHQTWTNFELILIDDASGPNYKAIFDEVVALDSRIKLIQLGLNGGTYKARNIGYASSTGTYITGQDDDDWSHPERLEKQVQYLRDHAGAIACKVNGIQCDDMLGRVRMGYEPVAQNASSLMVRREGYEIAGDYLPARKAADTEYQMRLAAVSGKTIDSVEMPLSIIRISPNSLSREHFSAGWKHPTRRSFRSAYEYWHKTSRVRDLCLRNVTGDVAVPNALAIGSQRDTQESVQVVIAADWSKNSNQIETLVENIRSLVDANVNVGILNLESPRSMHKALQVSLIDQIQSLINEGVVSEVFLDDSANVELLIFRDPATLQFIEHQRSRLEVKKMVVVADYAPSNLSDKNVQYLIADCHVHALEVFGVAPYWTTAHSQIRDSLLRHLNREKVISFDLSWSFEPAAIAQQRHGFRSIRPVVGRYLEAGECHWPCDQQSILQIHPTNGSQDVRIYGDPTPVLDILEEENIPAAWTVYESDEIEDSVFLRSLDFIIYQPCKCHDIAGVSILNAIAAGVLVILPPEYKEVFGEAAIYAEPHQISAVVRERHSGGYDDHNVQLMRAKSVISERYGREVYVSKVRELLTL